MMTEKNSQIVPAPALNIFLDESGTPGDDEPGVPFVFGGFSTFQNIGNLRDEWVAFASQRSLTGRKSRRWESRYFLDLAEFMCNQQLLPVSGFVILEEEDIALLRRRVEEYMANPRLRGPDTPERMTPANYVWPLLAACTCALAIAGQILDLDRRVGEFHLHIDQFKIDERVQFVAHDTMVQILSSDLVSLLTAKERDPSVREKLRALAVGVRGPYVNWDMKGPLKEAADAVCTMQRRILEGCTEACQARDVLRYCFRPPDTPEWSFGYNLTAQLMGDLLRPWPFLVTEGPVRSTK